MDNIECRLCRSRANFLFEKQLVDLDIKYYECETCEYVFTEEPYWLDKAYDDVMNITDTGILSRNLDNARMVLVTLFFLRGLDKKVVDFAGGYGILVRLLRDAGVNAFWTDPYAENLLARGFEYEAESAKVVTAFEVLEHLSEPANEIGDIFSIAPNILVSTNLMPKPVPEFNNWWYYGREHGQHVGFFRMKTLKFIAKQHDKNLVSYGGAYHLFTEETVNTRLWKWGLRFRKPITFLLEQFLESKIWSDHETMKNKI